MSDVHAAAPPKQEALDIDPTGGLSEGMPSQSQPLPEKIHDVKDAESFEAVPFGEKFKDPEGNIRKRYHQVKSSDDFDMLPEDTEFQDPEGNIRKKPAYKGIGFTAQALVNMAQTEEGKEKALRRVYGDKVKRDASGQLVVDDDGVLRKPGNSRGGMEMLGGAAAETAPALGMGLGGLVGGATGTALATPGAGTAAGGVGGAILGAMAGRQFNNIILSMAGIHEGLGTQIQSMGMEGAAVAGGEVLGRGIAKGASFISGMRQTANEAYAKAGKTVGGLRENFGDALESVGITPEKARQFLGTDSATMRQAGEITEKGLKENVRVSPAVMFPGAPMLKKIAEFHEVFEGKNVFAEAAERYYNQEARALLERPEIGTHVEDLLTQATKKVSSEEAGKLAIAAKRMDMAQQDAALENMVRNTKFEVMRPISEAGGDEAARKLHAQQMTSLVEQQKKAAGAAQEYIQAEAIALRQQSDKVVKMVAEGENPDAFHKMNAEAFKSYNRATRLRAKGYYDNYDTATRGLAPPDTTRLSDDAKAFLLKMPESLRARYPSEIKDLERLAGTAGDNAEAAGVEAVDPQNLTFGQLHHLRSWFRYGIDYSDMTPDMKMGALKHFEQKLNTILHPTAEGEAREASKLLDVADQFYKTNIPFLDDQMVKSTIKSLESGAGMNPEALSKVFFDPDRIAAMKKARGIVGENLWSGVEAADTAQMVKNSLELDGTIDGKKFTAQVVDRLRNGILENGYNPKLAARVQALAKDFEALEGNLPIEVTSSDTVSTLVNRIAATKQAVDKMAEMDPFKALKQSMAKADKDFNQAQQVARQGRRGEALHFLYEDSMSQMAVKAADRILGSQDLIQAAAKDFSRDSNEFKALQKVYVTRLLQRPLGRVGSLRAEIGSEKQGITEEVQALMLPGVTRDMLQTIAKDAEFLFGGIGSTDVGGSLAAAARVLHPMQHLPIPSVSGPVGKLVMGIPGVETGARFVLGRLFDFMMDATTHPNFVHWVAGNLKAGQAEREVAREAVRQRLKLGGMVGSALGQVSVAPGPPEAQQ